MSIKGCKRKKLLKQFTYVRFMQMQIVLKKIRDGVKDNENDVSTNTCMIH
jgi:hypothetical protein